MSKIKLTQDELCDLSELAWGYADRNDDDPEYFNKFEALHKKLVAMAIAMRDKEGGNSDAD
jgi:hypothetical protein